jgi:hypothetical protein
MVASSSAKIWVCGEIIQVNLFFPRNRKMQKLCKQSVNEMEHRMVSTMKE